MVSLKLTTIVSCVLYFLLLTPPDPVHCANILVYHHISSDSHRIVSYPLADALQKKGHQVTYISPYPPKGYINPNIKEIVPQKFSATIKSFLEADFHINYRVMKLIPRNVDGFFPPGIISCDDILPSPELQEFFRTTKKLDLVIVDDVMAECGMAIVHKYKAKHIFLNTVVMIPHEHDYLGVVPENSAIPETELEPPQTPMTFMERVYNTLISLHFRYVHYNYLKEIDRVIRKHMNDPTMPFVDDLARNASLVLYTGDIVTDYPRSHPPLFVNIGGMHVKKGNAQNIPKDIKDFIESGDSEGFVYISLGSLVISSNLPDQIKQVFYDTIESYPKLKFLWKWNGPKPSKLPKNLFLSEWFPQVDLLAHPKIKGFLMQAGRPSAQEAVLNGVPMISFPVLGDQDVNANRLEKIGATVVLELGTVTRDELKRALDKVVYDKTMKEKLMRLKNIHEDQPMSALDRAVWWTEYVLRQPDTAHLRSASFDQSWYQRRMVDVWGFIFGVIAACLTSIVLFLVVVLKIVRKLSGNGNSTKRNSAKKKN